MRSRARVGRRAEDWRWVSVNRWVQPDEPLPRRFVTPVAVGALRPNWNSPCQSRRIDDKELECAFAGRSGGGAVPSVKAIGGIRSPVDWSSNRRYESRRNVRKTSPFQPPTENKSPTT